MQHSLGIVQLSMAHMAHMAHMARMAQGAHGGGVGSSSRCKGGSFCFELVFFVVGVSVELCLLPWWGLRRTVRGFSAKP